MNRVRKWWRRMWDNNISTIAKEPWMCAWGVCENPSYSTLPVPLCNYHAAKFAKAMAKEGIRHAE